MSLLQKTFILLFSFCSCNSKHSGSSLTILKRDILDSLPSGSGIFVKTDTAFIIGDDATGIYQLALTNLDQQKIPISGFDFSKYREPKPDKHDFESTATASW